MNEKRAKMIRQVGRAYGLKDKTSNRIRKYLQKRLPEKDITAKVVGDTIEQFMTGAQNG